MTKYSSRRINTFIRFNNKKQHIYFEENMKVNIHRSNQRGGGNFGWLKTKYSFSFSNYYNPSRMGFGKIRVLNDDIISPNQGFGKHPHDNMEIITIPLEGELEHEDSTGSKEIITPGEIQVMSAGSGIIHSEFNASSDEELKLFQIWIETAKHNIEPRHETKKINLEKNRFTKIVSGNEEENTIQIFQDASIYMGEFDKETKINFETKKSRGTFSMIIEGFAKINEEEIEKRDSIEIEETQEINFEINRNSKILIIDTPM